jgi:co-chaperonin GroES (HSP10)
MKENQTAVAGPIDVLDRRRFEDNGEPKSTTDVSERKFKLLPRHKWVLIRQVQKEEVRTEAGVVIPAADFFLMKGEDKSQRGVVVAPGPESDLKEGDLVIFTAFPMEIEGLKDLTGDELVKLVRDEEVYSRVVECQ